jgi:4-amino-4-deoxy-L-arabinose transferase-like glycosyltransferase
MYDVVLELRTSRLALGVLTTFFLGSTFIWLRLDRTPPAWDDAYYLTSSLAMYDGLAEGGLPGYARQVLTVMRSKPPLIAILPTPVYLLVGRKPRAAFLVNLISLLLLFVTLYRLGKRYSSRRAGLIALFISGTMPMIYGLSHWYLVECGLVAIVCLAIVLIAEWNETAGTWKAFLLGGTFGLGLLMKFSFPVYVLIPLIYQAAKERRAWLRPNILLAFTSPIVVLAAPWYLLNFRHAVGTALRAGSSETGKLYGTGELFSLVDLRSYFSQVFNAGPALYFALLPLLLLVYFRVLPSRGKRGLLLSLLWGSPLLFLAFGHYRDLRYAAPLFPALALALGILADTALERSRAAALVYLPIALATLSMLQSSFHEFGNSRFDLGGLLFVAPRFDYARRYNRAAWPHQEILADIYRAAKFNGDEKKRLIVGTDTTVFNVNNFELAAAQRKLPFQVVTTAYETDLNKLISLVDSAAYFVYEEGGAPGSPFNKRAEDALKEVRGSGRFSELPIARLLPDGGMAHVFANVTPSRLTWTGAFLSSGMDRLKDCNVIFDARLQLTGLWTERTSEGIEVRYRWRALKPMDRAYWNFTHLVEPNGGVAGFLDHQILNGDPPTSLWKEGDVAIEKLFFRFSGLQKDESFRLRLGVFDRVSGERLPITAGDFPLTDQRTAAVVSEQQVVH